MEKISTHFNRHIRRRPIKSKGNFSLCLTKYHATKIYPLLNTELRHEDVWGSEDIAPRILNIGTKWR